MFKVIKNVKSIIFLFNILFIFITEIMMYYVFKDFAFFVQRLSLRLAKINTLYVKIFQAFALNNNLIDGTINNELLKFTDNVPWDSSELNLLELNKMCNKYNIISHDGFEKPINSGLVSLVFLGYEKISNEQKIIKIKRKNIEQKLDESIDNLLFLVNVLSFIPTISNYKLFQLINKNIDIIKRQTNFFDELDNMEKIRTNCKNIKYVKIPKANRNVTEDFPNIILMERIQGMTLDKINKEDYESFAKLIIKFGITTTVIHGITHGDLHSGNILFIKDIKDIKNPYKIGIIDFGIIYKVNLNYKDILFDILTTLFEESPRNSAEKILNSGILEPEKILQKIPKHDYENILSFTTDLVNEAIFFKKANQIQIYKFLTKFNDYLIRKNLSIYHIRFSDDFVKLQLVLAMSHDVTISLCKNNYINLMDKSINELFNTELFF